MHHLPKIITPITSATRSYPIAFTYTRRIYRTDSLRLSRCRSSARHSIKLILRGGMLVNYMIAVSQKYKCNSRRLLGPIDGQLISLQGSFRYNRSQINLAHRWTIKKKLHRPGCFSFCRCHFCLCPVQDFLEFAYAMPHPGMHVGLGTLDVVMEIIPKQLNV